MTSDGGQQQRARSEAGGEADQTPPAAGEVKERQDKLSEDVDAILDEIDDVLEENAEEFIRGYVQKGGE